MELNEKPTEYLSYNTVLSMYGIVKYVPTRASFATTDISKRSGESAIYHHMPAELMFGYQTRKTNGSEINIAEPEKAFLDLILLAQTGRATIDLDEIDLSHFCSAESLIKLDEYSKRMHIDYKRFLMQESKKFQGRPSDYEIPKELAA